MKYKKRYTYLLILILISALSGCGGDSKIKNIAKGDMDMAADTVVKSLDDYIMRLAHELYRTNPDELAKSPNIRLEHRLNQIVDYPVEVAYHEIDNKQQVDAIELALDDSYDGDRVFALMIGISSMIRFAYNGQREFFLFDTIDPQKVYNSSYNLQLLKQKLAGISPALLQIDVNPSDVNNAYTLLEKISTTQDLMARIISDETSRVLNKSIVGTAAVFIPII